MNVYPNLYRIDYKGIKGNKQTKLVGGLTKHEAMNRFRLRIDFASEINAIYFKRNEAGI